MIETMLDGETRLHLIIGDPIAQVKSPAGFTQEFASGGHNAILVPAHVAAEELHSFMEGIHHLRNLDGMLVTVPHKLAAVDYCSSLTDRAEFLRAVNAIRRNPDGSWHGEMTDGAAFVDAIRAAGCKPEGLRALLIGAGGAGSAIGAALIDAGVVELAIHDIDQGRRDTLLDRFSTRYRTTTLRTGSPDPSGFDLVANASTAGLRVNDPLPIMIDRLERGTFVGDVQTVPAVSRLIEAARRIGCPTQMGLGMYAANQGRLCRFLLGAWAQEK